MDGDKSDKNDVSGQWQYSPTDTAVNPKSDGQNKMLHSDEHLSQTGAQLPAPDPSDSVTWSASEFIAHQKSAGWYMILVLVTVVFAGVVFFLTKDKITTFVVIFVAIIFGIYAARKPRTLKYAVDDAGLTIADHFYEYARFRAFALVQEGAFSSIVFIPAKRFMPYVTVYYDPKDEQKITDILSDRMPLDTHMPDLIEALMRRIRF